MAFDLQGYVTVAERHRLALEKWPELRVQETPPKLIEAGNQLFIEVTTTVWRTPDDPLPAIASCWEAFPGTTPYTRGSEQQNASTSALGRCLGLMGVAIEAGMASKDEIVLAKQRNSVQRHPSSDRPAKHEQLRVVSNSEPEPPPPPGPAGTLTWGTSRHGKTIGISQETGEGCRVDHFGHGHGPLCS